LTFPVVVWRGSGALEIVAPLWDRLSQAVDTPVFMTLPWAAAWLRHLAPRAEPWFLVAGEPPVAIWPLALQRCGPLRVLSSLGKGVSDYLGPLSEERPVELISAFVHQLRSEAKRYDVLDLASLFLNADHLAALHRGLSRLSMERVYETCPIVSTAGNWETYLRTRTRKFRANLKRAERRANATAAADVRVEPYSPDLFAELVDVETQSWKWQAGTAYLQDPSRRRFLQAVLGDPRIPSELWTCRVDKHLAAFAVIFLGRRVRHYYLPSFDRRYSDAGTYLLQQIVRLSFGGNTSEVDLLQGDEGYKSAWATTERVVRQFASAGASLRGGAAVAALRARWRLANSPALRAVRTRIRRRRRWFRTEGSGE
jgi:CelD/BcsL family acetyltransferase involved in cellulose biosynthesis